MKEIEDLKKLVDKIESNFKELQDKLAKEKVILVPKNIQIGKMVSGRLVIKNNKQALMYSKDSWQVFNEFNIPLVQCKLIPCKREEIKKGDIFYRSDSKNPDFKDLYGYTIALKDNADEYAWWYYNDIHVKENDFNYYYKVIAF